MLACTDCNMGKTHMFFVTKSQVLDTNASGLPIWSVRLNGNSRDYTNFTITINPWFGLKRRMEAGDHGSFDSLRAECIAKGEQLWLKQGADHLIFDDTLLLLDFNRTKFAVLDSAYDPSWQRKVYTRFIKTIDYNGDSLFIFEWDGVIHHRYANMGSHLIYFSKNKGFIGITELCRDYGRTDTICTLGNTPGISIEKGIDCVPCRCAR
jgi:hypothetical protein